VDGDSSDQGRLGASFERALANLWIAFQPIGRPSDQTVFGYEALLRSDEPLWLALLR
jgi:EAL domain-containing protein (putative c-di-GMP-specific phosphodiesterase class I)